MYRSQHFDTSGTRGGIILMVVLFMLTLFAIAGISLVLYADAEAQATRNYRDANTLLDVPDMDPELAFSYFLGQLMYDAWDDESGVYSSLRGHSLARNMYGMKSTISSPTALNYIASANNVPFNGTGRLHYLQNLFGQQYDDYYLVNYMYFQNDGFLRDPECLGTRQRTATGSFLRTVGQPDNRGPFVGGFNPSYTYPDINHFFLGHVRTADGRVMLPSFHRPWLFGSLTDRANPNWTNQIGKYLTLRPRPEDHAKDANGQPLFPYPDDDNGDVKNLIAAPGGNDSLWMDIGAPILTLPGGRKYKMLVAPLIIDLDGRLNVNVHGNLMGPGQTHASNMGWGPWEINLSGVLNAGGGAEWKNVILGTQTQTPLLYGRYGQNQIPQNTGIGTAGSTRPHFYAQVDFNAAREVAAGTQPDRITPSGFPGAPPLALFPFFAPERYNNGLDPNSGTPPPPGLAERQNHASRYNAFRSANYLASNDDRVFAASNMAALFRVNDTGSEGLTSELLRLLPQNLITDPGAEVRRRLITTHSFDRNQPGVIPYIYNDSLDPAANSNKYPAPDPNWTPHQWPIGSSLAFPDLVFRTTPPPGFYTVIPTTPPLAPRRVANGDFELDDWRTPTADMVRVELNRSLTAYPINQAADLNATYKARFDIFDPRPPLTVTPFTNFDAPFRTIRSLGAANRLQHSSNPPMNHLAPAGALLARQTWTNEIYRRLLRVAGVPPIVPPAGNPFQPTDEELVPRRWLAQLAVNIVDYLDEDDISTPFNFYTETDAYAPRTRSPLVDPPFDIGALSLRDPNDAGSTDPELPRYWVFGTELPKVVLNEAMLEYQPVANPGAGDQYGVNVWVELFNTMQVPSQLPAWQSSMNAHDGYPIPLYVKAIPQGQRSDIEPGNPNSNYAKGFAPYRVVVANRLLQRPNNDNVLGTPDQQRCATADSDFSRPVNQIAHTAANPRPQPPQQFQLTRPPAPRPPPLPPPLPIPPVPVQVPYIDAQGGQSDSAFFLIGPGPDARDTIKAESNQGRVPDATPFMRSTNLRYAVTYDDAVQPVPDDRPAGVTVMLRRLANPHLPYNPERTVRWFQTIFGGGIIEQIGPNPYYNPYVTVDYMDANPLNDTTNPQTVYASRGKRHPLAAFFKPDVNPLIAAADSPVVDQELTAPPPLPDPLPTTRHSFGQTNTPLPLSGRYEWLVHLDRNVVSPMELLHVSGLQPHLLTQRFIVGDDRDPTMKFKHYVPWFDQDLVGTGTSHRLYRFFEFVDARDRQTGVSDDRIPGKININSVWDEVILQALIDPSVANYFGTGDVTAIFNQMIARRSPGGNGTPGPVDRPFLGVAAGLSPTGAQYPLPRGLGGIEETVLASFDGTGAGRRLFQPPIPAAGDAGHHPYMQYQMLAKIFDNMTTRSNVFAVWCTIGFFEVVDDSTRPAKLGPELGRAEGRQVRHRMFAIIDRHLLAGNTGPRARFDPHGDTSVLYFSIIK